MAGPETSVRAARDHVTRTAILTAARRSFARRGYGGTSIRQLAADAGVAPRTIYLTFGSKRGVLQAMVDGLGIDAGEPVTRALGQAVDDPGELLALVAQLYRRLYEHGNEVIVLLREGAATEPPLRELLESGLERSRQSIAGLCRRLQELGALRPGLTADRAAGHALVLVSHDGYDELVVRRGWSHDTYQCWLESSLGDALLVT